MIWGFFWPVVLTHTFLFHSARQTVESGIKRLPRLHAAVWLVWSAQTWTLGTLFTHVIVTCKPPFRKHKIHLYIFNVQAMTAQTEQGERKNKERREEKEGVKAISEAGPYSQRLKCSGRSQHTHPFCGTKWKCFRREVSVLVFLTAEGQISLLVWVGGTAWTEGLRGGGTRSSSSNNSSSSSNSNSSSNVVTHTHTYTNLYNWSARWTQWTETHAYIQTHQWEQNHKTFLWLTKDRICLYHEVRCGCTQERPGCSTGSQSDAGLQLSTMPSNTH